LKKCNDDLLIVGCVFSEIDAEPPARGLAGMNGSSSRNGVAITKEKQQTKLPHKLNQLKTRIEYTDENKQTGV
jgi:hypothetical protein